MDVDNPSPLSLAFLLLALALLTPVTWLLTWGLHGLKPRWMSSVWPRIRWRFFVACLGLAVVAMLVTVAVSVLLPANDTGEMGQVNDFTTTTRNFLIVIVLLTPLQAAGEEYAFRGYLTQAFGGVFAFAGPAISRAIAVVVPAVIFALSHGAQSAPVFFDRLAFGLVAGWLVIRTGGLEAAIAMHVMNNFVAFGFALAFGDLASSLNPAGGNWWLIPSTLTQSLAYLGLATLVARGMNLTTRSDPAVLAASRGLVYRFPPPRTGRSPG